jgi:putative DNA primase/helicase
MLEVPVTPVTPVTVPIINELSVTAQQMSSVTPVTANDCKEFSFSEPPNQLPESAKMVSVPESERPCFRVHETWGVSKETGRKQRPGVWAHTLGRSKTPEAGPQLINTWLCSPLYVEAITHDTHENNFGRLLRFQTSVGKWRRWAMPMELLRGSGEELRGELLAMGVEMALRSRSALTEYLQAERPRKTVLCALQVGWVNQAFVLPDTVIGPGAAEVIFQSGERANEEYEQGGTLHGWQTGIAALAVGNPLLMLALSAAFAGPLLQKTHAEGGGLHFFGESSTGKTTLLEAACSVWGGKGYRRSWKTTANGLEGAAVLFNDGLLALDEISEADPQEVGSIVYSLGNGRGKQRASRGGSAKAIARWHAFILSTGERTIETTMQEGGHRSKAGQGVRLLDVPASRGFGCFDDLHGHATGTALSDALKRAASMHYGRAGRAYLERLTREDRDVVAWLERLKEESRFNPQDGEGQDKRAASRFALVGLAGELASEYGIVPWPKGAALDAAEKGFELWRGIRGRGNQERRQVLEQVLRFVERHGDSRFSSLDDSEAVVRDRAGWWTAEEGQRVYLFTSEGMREALKGFDFKQGLNKLQMSGALPHPGTDGKRARAYRFGGRVMKLYPIKSSQLEGDYA